MITTAAVEAVGLDVRRGRGRSAARSGRWWPGADAGRGSSAARSGRAAALEGCSFRIPRGAVCGLVGPNGAGKSALLAAAAGLVAPTAGQLRLFGLPAGDDRLRTRVAHLDQNRSLYRRFTVRQLLDIGRDLNPGWRPEAAAEVLELSDIPSQARAGALSGGQRTLLALALARGKGAELLLLDEPLADLDPLVRRRTLGLLLADVAAHGSTLVLSSHVLTDLEESVDHLLLLDRGSVRVAGPLPELLDTHRLVDTLTAPDAASALVRLCPDRTTDPVTDGAADGTADGAARWVADGAADGETPTLEELVLAYLHRPETGGWISPGMRPLVAEEVGA